MSDAPAVLAENLVKRYPVFGGFRDIVRRPFRRPTTTALDGLSLQVGRGRAFCLLGPNGAGKTTLIKILTTLVIPDGGRAFVNGHDVVRRPALVKDAVGYAINDERSFYWRLTGRQNLEFFGALVGLRGAARDRKISEVFGLTGLEAAADLRFNAYSTGMRQMLAFARALLTDADILFVDEPTRSLDPLAADKIRAFLRRELVERRGKTVFWATHDLAEAASMAHEIAIIDRGRIRRQGSPAALTASTGAPLRQVYENALTAESGTEKDGRAPAPEEGVEP
jgi:ABC-2 type transport system ATP-binding protein